VLKTASPNDKTRDSAGLKTLQGSHRWPDLAAMRKAP